MKENVEKKWRDAFCIDHLNCTEPPRWLVHDLLDELYFFFAVARFAWLCNTNEK